jgi:hypothetical protein
MGYRTAARSWCVPTAPATGVYSEKLPDVAPQGDAQGVGPKVGLQTFNLLVWVRFPAPHS